MKTAVTVLQEMMVKDGRTPDYECIAQTGPKHQALFEYRCVAYGVSATAIGRSKKEAKQEAGRVILLKLDERGYPVPPPFCRGGAPVHTLMEVDGAVGGAIGGVGDVGSARNFVSKINELCEEYRLPAVIYSLTGDTGPPHARRFTMTASLGMHERSATSTTKKFARQLAAEQLYTYLKENVPSVIKDFVKDEALARAHEDTMETKKVPREEMPRRPNLGQKVADYHLCLSVNDEEEKRRAALEVLASSEGVEPEELLDRLVGALGMTIEWQRLPAVGGELVVLLLTPSEPELALAGPTPRGATLAALRFLRRSLGDL